MPVSDPDWERSQSHEREVYSGHEGISTLEKAEELFGLFGKNLQDLEEKNILSVGAGLGIIHALDFECNNIGIDPLTHHNKDKLRGTCASLVTGVGENLPFENNSVDVVYSYNVLDHCIEPKTVLDEAHQVTKDGGELLLEVNTYEVPKFVRETIVGRLDSEHPHHFSSKEIKSLVEKRGYKITKSTCMNRFQLLKNPTLRRIGAMPFRMRRCFITAQKV